MGVSVLVVFLAIAATAPAAAAAAQPLASAPTNWQGVTLDLMSVERKGSVVTVKWATRNEGAEQSHVQFGLVGANAKTYLVDEENGTKYFALTDKEGKGLASKHDGVGNNVYGVSDYIPAGATLRYWAKFPAPPPAVRTLTLLFDETEPFEEVPVTDK
jgi:ABC-type uncharacterized transport system substrate-binding protein